MRSRSSSTEPMQVTRAAALVLAAPDRQRRPPVAVARERPVDVVLQPFAEAAVLDVLGVPADRLVVGEQLVAGRGGARCTSWSSRSRGAACRSASSAGRRARRAARGRAGRGRSRSVDEAAGRLTPFHELAGEADDSVVEGAVGADRVVEGARDGRVEEARSRRRPGSRPRRRAGAMWTRPVPSSVVTKSPAITGKPPRLDGRSRSKTGPS